MQKLFAVGALALALMLGGCLSTVTEAFDYVKAQSVDKTAVAVDAYCDNIGENTLRRKAFIDAVNAKAKRARISAFDCDGDGAPDFKTEPPAPEVAAPATGTGK